MEIAIIGNHGVGKSNMADIIRNAIFKSDKDAAINMDDDSRDIKVFGHGKNIYNIHVAGDIEVLSTEPDILINIKGGEFKLWFDKMYS